MLPFTCPVAQLALTMEVNGTENRSSVLSVGFRPLPQTTPNGFTTGAVFDLSGGRATH